MADDQNPHWLSPSTSRNDLLYCRKFPAFYLRSPEELGAPKIRSFLLRRVQIECLSYDADRRIRAALQFLYTTLVSIVTATLRLL